MMGFQVRNCCGTVGLLFSGAVLVFWWVYLQNSGTPEEHWVFKLHLICIVYLFILIFFWGGGILYAHLDTTILDDPMLNKKKTSKRMEMAF